MNIFALDLDPALAARMQCDKHVVKMTLETAQILSTVNHSCGLPALYRPTHVHHPCVRWAHVPAHRRWLERHFVALLEEYTFRYGRVHACSRRLPEVVLSCDDSAPITEHDFVEAMPSHHRMNDGAVAAYRRYYAADKARFARWNRGRPPPDWWIEAR